MFCFSGRGCWINRWRVCSGGSWVFHDQGNEEKKVTKQNFLCILILFFVCFSYKLYCFFFRYDDLHHIAKSQNEQIVETAENSVLMGTEHAFDPNAYCQAKMNIAAVSSDGMPFKPEPLGNHNLIKTKFKVVTY